MANEKITLYSFWQRKIIQIELQKTKKLQKLYINNIIHLKINI